MARGYLRKRGDRSWQIVYDVPRAADGKRRQRFETVHGNKRQAEARLAQVLDSLRRDRYVTPTNITLADFLGQFLRDYAEVNCRPRTVQGYRDIVRVHLEPGLGSVRLSRLTAHDIQRYYAARLRGGLSPLTVRHHHRLLHRALEIAVMWELLERNPSRRITLPAVGPSPARALSADEVRRLLDAARPTAYYLPIHLALYTGFRRSELLGLRWRDVDFDRRVLRVERTMIYLKGQGHVWSEPKTRGSRRLVAIPEASALLLRSHRERMQAEHQERGMVDVGEQLCAFPDGNLMKPDTLTNAFIRLARGCGLDGVRFHDLRHTHASLLLGEGTPMHVVQSRLGHQSITTTVDIYGHVLAEADIAAGESFERVVSTKN